MALHENLVSGFNARCVRPHMAEHMDESHRELPKKLGATRDPNPSDNNATGRLDENIYDMESCEYRGHALVINNYEFETSDKNRKGWEADSENLKKLFNFLRFEQHEHFNLNAKKMKEAIASFARDQISLNASSLAVVIMTHGDKTSFTGVDGHEIRRDDVLLKFSRDNAPDLIEKPKLFLFQACRGDHEDFTLEDSASECESEALVVGATAGQPVQSKTVPMPNMLIVNATLPGYRAYRNPNLGSWLIGDFCRIVRSKARKDHVADIITEVSRVLNDREAKQIQQIHPENLLSRKWFLFPRESLQHELRTYYDDKLKCVFPIPWLPIEGFSLTGTFVQRRLRVTSGEREGNLVGMDEILASVGKGRNKRILVEGDPAQGKSTLCQALAYAWSQPGEATEDIKSFDLVILLHAGDLRGQDSVAEAIKTHLLPKDCDITSGQVNGLLLAKNVLLIIDAFDEAANENEILHQLIEGKLLKHKTLLLTSRPNFLKNKLLHFHSTATVEGYNEKEQLEHVRRYAEHKKIASAPFESLIKEESVRDLCNNPLNLTLLCLLREEEEDTQLMLTRTALYTEIHGMITRKAGERLELTEAEVEELLLRPLYQFAFEAYRKNETVVREKDSKNVVNFEQVCQVGYLTKELVISRLQAEVRFGFTHKSFLEFLTAKHIAQMDREERLTWLQDLRYANYYIQVKAIEDDFDVRQNEPVLGFLFALMEQNSEELTQMAIVIMEETHFSSKPHPILHYSRCVASHQLMRLIDEVNDVPSKLGDEIVNRLPPHINIHQDCSVSCRRGILKLGKLRLQAPIPLNVYLGSLPNEEKNVQFVKDLIECKNIKCSKVWIYPEVATQLRDSVSELRIGQAESFQQVSIKCINIKVKPYEWFSFGDKLSGLELDSFNPSLSYLLEAALDKPLHSLHLNYRMELDGRCILLLQRLLRNELLQSVQLWSSPWKYHFDRFLADVAQLKNLQSLEIQLKDLAEEERRSLETILKINKLIKLKISIYANPPGLYNVLNNSFKSMSSLRELNLKRVNITQLPNMRHFDLVSFTYVPLKLNDNQIAFLSGALRSWHDLQELDIDFKTVSVAECSLWKLFKAIAGCHRLQILHFNCLEIGDSVVPLVCKMIESLKQLREFTSEEQRDESLTEEGFKQLEPIFKRKGLYTCMR
ncbi:hypothetical protein CAPTEDRAFT_186473 [Capitella teleta]|uniref:Caspase family p20 domain-containing protein n=1 Tax=Capitella teleta TaxID=283909 RepID=R7TWP8_CAPTE|nr:hypothetical protein CAPTEDRAFT_186473 [Capitella teleta]|eukprot:ELT98313.1 hypothetical protein CAPTEDRAFT_186473 [Capitella teleta]